MNKTYLGDWPATIVSYDANARTARITIPTVTDGLDEGVEATFAYPVGDDDLDTERKILPGADCYIFFLQGDPYSPVIWAFRSHGKGAVVDTRRIRQKNIELLASANITLQAEEQITLKAKKLVIDAEVVMKKKTTLEDDLTVQKKTTLVGGASIRGVEFDDHGHDGVKNGEGVSGGVHGL